MKKSVRIGIFATWAVLLSILAASGGPQAKTDRIGGVKVEDQGRPSNRFTCSVAYEYSSDHGVEVFASAVPLQANGEEVRIKAAAQKITRGQGTVRLTLEYAGAGPVQSSRIRVILFQRDGQGKRNVFFNRVFDLNLKWAPAAPAPKEKPFTKAETKPAPALPQEAAGSVTGLIPRAKAAPALLKAAEKGEAFRLMPNGDIELVKANIRNLSSQSLDLGGIRVSVDYSLYENHGQGMEIGVEALNRGTVVKAVATRPVPAHPGIGSARLSLALESNQASVSSDQLRFYFNSKSEGKRFYSRNFDFKKDWRQESPSAPASAKRKARVDVLDVRPLSSHAVQVNLKYWGEDEKTPLTLRGAVYDGSNQKMPNIVFSAPQLRPDKGDAAARLELKGDGPVSSKTMLIELVAGGRTLDEEKVALSRTWGKKSAPAVAAPVLPPNTKLVKGTMVEPSQDAWKIRGDDNVIYYIQMASTTDFYSPPRVGERVSIACPYASSGDTTFYGCWYPEAGMKLTGSVVGLACTGSNPKVTVQAIGSTLPGEEARLQYTCYFKEANACQGLNPWDFVEVTGEADPADAKTIRNCVLTSHRQPQVKKLETLSADGLQRTSVTQAADWDILAQIDSSLVQDYIHDYYVKHPNEFTYEGMTVTEPMLSLWGQGRNQACLKMTAKEGIFSSDLELYFRLAVDTKDIWLDFSGASCLLLGIQQSASAQSSGNTVVNEAIKVFKSLGRINVPLSMITSSLPSSKCLLPNGGEIVLSNIFKAGLYLRPVSTKGNGYIILGLSYLRPDMPNRNYGRFSEQYYYEFGQGQPVAIAVSNWILTGLVNQITKPVATLAIDPPLGDIRLAIVDVWDAEVRNGALNVHEAWLDFYKIDIPWVPDCGEWEEIFSLGFSQLLWTNPSLGHPGNPGYRCHTHGARLYGWVLPLGVTVWEDGTSTTGFVNVGEGRVYDRSDSEEDMTKMINAGLFENIQIVTPSYPIPELNKTITVHKIGGNAQELLIWLKTK